MNLVNGVFELAEKFMRKPRYVFINEVNIENLSRIMLASGVQVFKPPKIKNEYKATVIELVCSSINYNYWYGKHDIRPNGSSSTYLYELAYNAFYDYEKISEYKFRECIERLSQLLSVHRFPLLEERIKHLKELYYNAEKFSQYLCNEPTNLNDYLTELVTWYPGFASDMFLKRASLFFIQLYRRFGWFKEDLLQTHIPADYQIPKMLEDYGSINYVKELEDIIENNTLIPKHSQMECEIRSATILTARKLCELTGWTVADVDSWLFSQRHNCKNKFHITETTDY